MKILVRGRFRKPVNRPSLKPEISQVFLVDTPASQFTLWRPSHLVHTSPINIDLLGLLIEKKKDEQKNCRFRTSTNTFPMQKKQLNLL